MFTGITNAQDNKTYKKIKLSLISKNPSQPRKYFDSDAIDELSGSIKVHGILNPLTVRKVGERYELIAGERRLRAAKQAGLLEAPCIVMTADQQASSVIALVENLQRRDLDFFEEAVGFKNLIENFGLTQEDIAKKVGKTQSAVANKLRLLRLSPEVCDIIKENHLTERHARCLIRIKDSDERLNALLHIVKHDLNVNKTEQYIDSLLQPKREKMTILRFIKDVRFFMNTVDKAVRVMRQAGVDATVEKNEYAQGITLMINIPTAKK